MEGGTPAGVRGLETNMLNHSPTGATGMAKLSPEDLKEMEASPDDIEDLATGSTGASGTTVQVVQLETTIFHLSGATGVRFKSVTTGSTGDAGIVDVETTEDNLNDDQANEVDTVKKIANKGYALITKYSDAHKLLVDVANKKDEAQTGVTTMTETVKELVCDWTVFSDKRWMWNAKMQLQEAIYFAVCENS